MVGFRPAWVWLGTNGSSGGRFFGTVRLLSSVFGWIEASHLGACDAGKMVFFTPS